MVVCFGGGIVASSEDGFPTNVVKMVAVDDPVRMIGRRTRSFDDCLLGIIRTVVDGEAWCEITSLEVDFFARNQVG